MPVRPLCWIRSSAAAALAVAATASPAWAWVAPAGAGVTLRDVASDGRGNVAAAGWAPAPGGASSLYVVRFSAGGALRWKVTEAGGTLENPAEASSVAVDGSGDVYVTGTMPVDGGASRFVVARYAAGTGQRVWLTALDGDTGRGNEVRIDGSGRVIVGGGVSTGEGSFAAAAALSASTGAVQWQWTAADSEVRDLAVSADGDVVVAGNALVARLDGGTGAEQWRTVEVSPPAQQLGFPQLRTVDTDRDGNVTVGGSLRNTFEDNRRSYLARLSVADGSITWEFVGNPATTFENASEVAVDASGTVYTGGRLQGAPAALRLNGSTGAVEWALQPWPVDRDPDTSRAVTSVALDSRHFYLAGAENGGRFLLAAVTRSGRARWRKDLGDGEASSLALGPAGQLYAAGEIVSGGVPQGVVVGLRATDGKQLKAGAAGSSRSSRARRRRPRR